MHKVSLGFGGLIAALLIVGCQQMTDGPVAPVNEGHFGPLNLAQKVSEGDPEILALMQEMNAELAAQGLNIAVESIEFFTIGNRRPSNRIHQQPFRWASSDANRVAQGEDITYIVDQSGQGTTSGVSAAATEARVDAAMATWDDDPMLRKVDIVKRADPGTDVTIFDFFCCGGGFGDPFAADIVNAGWFPAGPPWFGPNTLAFSVTFIFTGCVAPGVPCDVNGDNYIDTALNEVYYNDGFNWGLDVPLGGGIDVETVALHENGHSLGIGHFGPQPPAVMNPVYAGIRQDPFAADDAGMATIWNRWPN